MTSVDIIIDSKIHLDTTNLNDKIIKEIKTELEIENPAREIAEKEKIGGWWKIPRTISLWEQSKYNESYIVLPRGFLYDLLDGLREYGYEIELYDLMESKPLDQSYKKIDLREYQERALALMFFLRDGIWQAPPAAGKTVTILEMIRRVQQKSLIIVNKKEIAEQWKNRAKEFLGADIGIIGDNQFDDKDITVALQQTLWSKRAELQENGWFDKWGFVCLDECHHLPATTFTDILSRFSALYRIGVSGTPFKQKGMERIIELTLGSTIHITDKEYLEKEGWLVKPTVEIVGTGFDREFYPTHTKDECDNFPKCNKSGKRHQNNYSEIINDLIYDNKRNFIIAQNIVADYCEDDHTILVLSKRLDHLDEIARQVGYMLRSLDDIYQFTGKQSTDERMEIINRADKGKCIIFSTIAEEALDIPRIDRIHLAFPSRNLDSIIQIIGREARVHPDKKDARFYDYVDDCGPLYNQYKERFRNLYKPGDMFA